VAYLPGSSDPERFNLLLPVSLGARTHYQSSDSLNALDDGRRELGVADFHNGEMEVSRQDAKAPPSERLLLSSYRAVSEHGLLVGCASGWPLVTIAITVAPRCPGACRRLIVTR
jgi:hypothetical protein